MHSRIKIYNKFQKIEQRVSDDPSNLIYLIQIIFIYARFSCICLAYKDNTNCCENELCSLFARILILVYPVVKAAYVVSSGRKRVENYAKWGYH